MQGPFDNSAIAARIRGLLAVTGTCDPSGIAARLRVNEISVRAALDERAPNPGTEMVAAVIACCGVDPAWLLTGDYDAQTHRSVLADAITPREAIARVSDPGFATGLADIFPTVPRQAD